jgi:1-hydroxycarotenoid 3,4-desaturase
MINRHAASQLSFCHFKFTCIMSDVWFVSSVEEGMSVPKVVIIGAGIGGLTAALILAARGVQVILLEQADAPGGKMRQVMVGGRPVEAGPTVLTLRATLERILVEAGLSLDRVIAMQRADVIARHAWSERERLDLYADVARSADAIGHLAGAAAARGFLEFSAHARRVHQTMEGLFMLADRPSPAGMVINSGLNGVKALWSSAPFTAMWDLLGRYFTDPRLRQLFGRYATYCGSSPFLAPATLALIADVEQQGVWIVEGGMSALARALANAAGSAGAHLRFGTAVARIVVSGGRATGVELATRERIEADAIVHNGDVGALCMGLLGAEARNAVAKDACEPRSLSALTWMQIARPSGFPLAHHSVFFSRSSETEFADLFERRRSPLDPTVYICAQDRSDGGTLDGTESERLLIIVNAPADGGASVAGEKDWLKCRENMTRTLLRSGLSLGSEASVEAGPAELSRLFPGTDGAIYGMASHGWTASFRRSGVRSKIPGLYLAGGSVHPGSGVPMAALSGRAAARAVISDLTSMRRSHPVAMRGGTSTR